MEYRTNAFLTVYNGFEDLVINKLLFEKSITV